MSKRINQILFNQSGFCKRTIPGPTITIFAATTYHEIRRPDGSVATIFHESQRHNSHRTISTTKNYNDNHDDLNSKESSQ